MAAAAAIVDDVLGLLIVAIVSSLAKGKVKKELVVHINLRAKKYDEYAKSFLIENPDGVIVRTKSEDSAGTHRGHSAAARDCAETNRSSVPSPSTRVTPQLSTRGLMAG